MGRLKAVVERVVFRNPDSGYTVLRARCQDGDGADAPERFTAVGEFADIAPGECVTLEGEWNQHPTYGMQFRVSSYLPELPVTPKGIQRYLESSAIKGLGSVMAQRVVEKFGKKTLEVFAEKPEALLEVEGIGRKRLELIRKSWLTHEKAHKVMAFLRSSGVTAGRAARLYRKYGDEVVDIVQKNPYRLIDEVDGIGFKIADKIAVEGGLGLDSTHRLAAGVLHVLKQAAEAGHVCLPRPELLEEAEKVLEQPAEVIAPVLDGLLQKGRLRTRPPNLVYLPPFYAAEERLAENIRSRLSRDLASALLSGGFTQEVARKEREFGLTLSSEQREAVASVFSSGCLVITGGPGTGKTTIMRVALALAKERGWKVELAAPTGRAAKRLQESAGHRARTIHRLLEFGYREGEGFAFGRDAANPVKADLVIIDEASMLDVMLADKLLDALRPETRLVLVGDVDQLPSVGAGNVLHDLIASGVVPVSRLTKIYRQAAGSDIVVNAHRIREGRMPRRSGKDYFFIDKEEPEQVLETVLELVSSRLPGYFGCDPLRDIQVLAPMRRTQTGVDILNQRLQEVLNPKAGGKPEVVRGDFVFRRGDKVMQVRNNYEKMVFNGDIGWVQRVNPKDRALSVLYPVEDGHRLVEYTGEELNELTLAYALSVHKSQGSEFPIVVMPVVKQHYIMLQRNLLYTAVTRAKKRVVLVGTKAALAIAVHNDKQQERYTALASLLRSGM